jgi:hypothetical protein
MKFSIYSELQTWPGKTQQQVYAEALEQCVNADRLGYSTYSIIEHFFFPKFGASPNPFAFFAKASERTRNINFRTLVHVLPYHNPAVYRGGDKIVRRADRGGDHRQSGRRRALEDHQDAGDVCSPCDSSLQSQGVG